MGDTCKGPLHYISSKCEIVKERCYWRWYIYFSFSQWSGMCNWLRSSEVETGRSTNRQLKWNTQEVLKSWNRVLTVEMDDSLRHYGRRFPAFDAGWKLGKSVIISWFWFSKIESITVQLTEKEGLRGELVCGTGRKGIVGFSHFKCRVAMEDQKELGKCS